MNQAELETELSLLYARVKDRWERNKSDLFSGQCGFSVLGSRPVLRPRLMIIGENPGFGKDDIGQPAHVEERWPDTSYLDGETWQYKRRLKSMFAEADSLGVLEEAVVTNFLFFKSGSHSREGNYRWLDLPPYLRDDLERFSYEEVEKLVRMLRPQQIMILGLSAFDQHANEKAEGLRATNGKQRLIGTGKLWGVPAFGITHPSGSRVSSSDWPRIANWLRRRL